MIDRQRAHKLASTLNPTTHDDDTLHFCSTCAFGSVCMAHGYNKASLSELHCLVEHIGPLQAGEHVFRTSEAFSAIYAVRAGTVKTYLVDDTGREQVLGFHLPGEMVGLNAIYPARYPCNAIALDTVTLCHFSFPAMMTLATRMPSLQEQLFRLISKDIGVASLLAGDYAADERLAAFLVSFSQRFSAYGFSATRFRLSMSRADIANYLRLAAETISRVLRRFQNDGLIHVDGREVKVLNPSRLQHLARCVLNNS